MVIRGSKLYKFSIALLLVAGMFFLPGGCSDSNNGNGGGSDEPPTQSQAIDPSVPLSSVVQVTITNAFGTGTANIPAFVQALVRARATGAPAPNGQFPLNNTTTDTVRTIPGLGQHVIVSWLDSLDTTDDGSSPRFGANNDFIAYFGDGWDSDWDGNVVGGSPNFNGSSGQGWLWVNHEYISDSQPSVSTAPTGSHLTLAKLLSFFGVLTNNVEDDADWSQGDLDTYIENWKKQVGGSWVRIVADNFGRFSVDRTANNLRYDATDNTLLKFSGFTPSLGFDDDGNTLPTGVVPGIHSDCSGGITPWGTIFTAEENCQFSYGDNQPFWTSRNEFVADAGADPGSPITFALESSSSNFGQHSDPFERKNRDWYCYISEIDVGENPSNFYVSINDGGDGTGHRKLGTFGIARWENVAIAVDDEFKLMDGEPIVLYAGDDRRSGRIYKYVTDDVYEDGMTKGEVRALLDSGDVYVSHFETLDNLSGINELGTGVPASEDSPGSGTWIHLSLSSTDTAPNAATLGGGTTVGEALADNSWNSVGGFSNNVDVYQGLFTAANKIGVRELNRPEDIEWNYKDLSGTPKLYVAFTNHNRQTANDNNGVMWTVPLEDRPLRSDVTGAVFAIVEESPLSPGSSTSFTYYAAWLGTEGDGEFDAANPDNILVDKEGGVFFGTDGNFGRNGTADALYYLDLDPANKAGMPGVVEETYGKAFRLVSMPSNAENTGPQITPNRQHLFMSVQHPGEGSEFPNSNWPQPR